MYRIPHALEVTVGATPEGRAWLAELPERIAELQRSWALRVGAPIESEASCSWVAPCETAAGEPAVLKLGFPHMEARDEIDGLAFWDGDPTVRLLRADRAGNALLLERCEPGTSLRAEDEETQDAVIASLLRRLWRRPPRDHGFRPLAEMITAWMGEALDADVHWPDRGLMADGIAAFRDLADSEREPVLLATDLHAGNVLRAERHPWLAIDPKPFVGDRCYDGTQHLLNCRARMLRAPHDTLRRLADRLEVDEQRFRRWSFARFALNRDGDVATTTAIATRLADR